MTTTSITASTPSEQKVYKGPTQAYKVLASLQQEQNRGLEVLRIEDISLAGKNTMKVFLQTLHKYHPNLTRLSLVKTELGSNEAWLLSIWLLRSHLKHLSLSRNYQMGPEGALDIVVSLIFHRYLRSLDLSECSLGPVGALHVGELLKRSKLIEHVNLRGNVIPSGGILQFAKLLEGNTSLRSLNLGKNAFYEIGAKALAELLAKPGCPLKKLDVCGNNIPPDVLTSSILGNRTLTQLDLSNTSHLLQSTEALCQLLESTVPLRMLGLTLSYTLIQELPAIGASLAGNTSLEYFDLKLDDQLFSLFSQPRERELIIQFVQNLQPNRTLIGLDELMDVDGDKTLLWPLMKRNFWTLQRLCEQVVKQLGNS